MSDKKLIWKFPETNGAQAIVRLENVDGANINHVEAKGTADPFVRVEGGDSKSGKVFKVKTPGIKKQVEVAKAVKTVA